MIHENYMSQNISRFAALFIVTGPERSIAKGGKNSLQFHLLTCQHNNQIINNKQKYTMNNISKVLTSSSRNSLLLVIYSIL